MRAPLACSPGTAALSVARTPSRACRGPTTLCWAQTSAPSAPLGELLSSQPARGGTTTCMHCCQHAGVPGHCRKTHSAACPVRGTDNACNSLGLQDHQRSRRHGGAGLHYLQRRHRAKRRPLALHPLRRGPILAQQWGGMHRLPRWHLQACRRCRWRQLHALVR